jgi:unsaturated chondroitin disaccharide hydrolase
MTIRDSELAAMAMAMATLVGCAGRAVNQHAEAPFAPDPALVTALEDALALAAHKAEATRVAVVAAEAGGARLYPMNTVADGSWRMKPVDSWTSGMFPGVLWQLYGQTGARSWRDAALAWTTPLAAMADNPIDHDQGFRFCLSYGAGLVHSSDGDDPGASFRTQAHQILVRAAIHLDSHRFNQDGIPVGAMRSEDDYPEGSHYPVFVDSMMNLCLPFLAWTLEGRPASGATQVGYQHALEQAATILDQNLRPDGSTYHIVEHNDGVGGLPADGHVYRKITDQGFAPESTWSRGQAWAIYGFAVVYRYARTDPSATAIRFRGAAQRAADYFISHLPANYTADRWNYAPGDFVPPSDFDAALGEPDGPWTTHKPGRQTRTRRDSSAAAIAAAGMLELAPLLDHPTDAATYFHAAENILRALVTYRGTDGKLAYLGADAIPQGILIDGALSLDYPLPNGSTIYGDVYFLDAAQRYLALTDPRP